MTILQLSQKTAKKYFPSVFFLESESPISRKSQLILDEYDQLPEHRKSEVYRLIKTLSCLPNTTDS